VSDCEKNHSSFVIGDSIQDPHLSDFLLVDVIDECLVLANPNSAKFIALSYVWGGVPTLKTTKATLQEHRQKGALYRRRSQLPQVIIDAILFAKGISMRYLWIDALCIIDDSEQKQHQIAHMDFIYSRAYLTIIPLCAATASSSICGVRPWTRFPSRKSRWVNGMKAEQAMMSLARNLSNSIYEQRSWTFQERILSKRCLFFTNNDVFFTCHAGKTHSCAYSESGISVPRPNFFSPPFSFDFDFSSLESADTDFILNTIRKFIQHYTSRYLTYNNDALNAFAGIMSVMSSISGVSFLYGLPEADLLSALLWISTGTGVQRNPGFPSWSWAGWIGGIAYVVPSLLAEKIGGNNIIWEIEIDKEHRSSGTQLGPASGGQSEWMCRPEILCFHTSKVLMAQFSFNYFDNEPVLPNPRGVFPHKPIYSISTKMGLKCGYAWATGVPHRLLNLHKRNASFILLSRIDVDVNIDFFFQPHCDKSFERTPFSTVLVMLVEQIGEYSERVQLCHIHETAWLAANPEPAYIKLA